MNQAKAKAVQRPLWRSALRVAIIYAGIAMAWIFATDIAVSHGQFSTVTVWSLTKGAFFVLVTATLLFFFVRAALRELHDSQQQLRISEERYRRVTESNIIGIFCWRLDGAITEANDAFLDLLGYTRADLQQGRIRWNDLTPPEYRARDAQIAESLRTGATFPTFEKEYFRRDGSRVSVLLGGALFVGSADEGVSFVLDISARKQAQMELHAAKEAAEAANRAKDHFLATLSHELRTPLAPVLLTLSTMESDAALPEAARADLRLMRRNVELETHIIDDLLDLTRIVQGRLRVNLEAADLGQLAREAVEICAGAARQKNVALQIAASAPLPVLADPARMLQVLWNLVINAVKFTPAGGTVWIKAAPADGQAQVVVQDDGAGIDPSVLANLFQPFEQGTLRPGTAGGLGLGLAIARQVTQAHRGHLAAASAGSGKGATFTLTLPLHVGPSPAASTRPPAASPAVPARLAILLVEDHADTALIMNRLLRAMGHQVTVAGNVRAACEKIAAGKFDLLISDIGLPDGTGHDILTRARPGMPAIAVSGFGMPEDVQRSLAAGFAEHLVKPINPLALESVLARVVTQAGAATSASR